MTIRNFGIPMRGTASLYRGGRSTDGPSFGDDTHAEPNSSLAPVARFKPRAITQTLIDISFIGFLGLFLSSFAAAVGLLGWVGFVRV